MAVHVLKTLAQYFEPAAQGDKMFEARLNDRGYAVGDTLVLKEVDDRGDFTGRQVYRLVTFVLYGPGYGIETGYCVMSLVAKLS